MIRVSHGVGTATKASPARDDIHPSIETATRVVGRAETSWSRLFTRLLVVLALLLTVLLVCQHLLVLTMLSSAPQVNYPSSVCVYHARNVMRGLPLYADWQEPPYVVAMYGPLFYWIPGTLGRLVRADTFELYAIGRWIALLSLGGIAVLIAWTLLRRERVGILISGIAAAMFVLGTVNYPHGSSFRPDSTGALLSLVGLCVARRFMHSNLRLVSLIPFLLAFLYKQSMVAGPAAVVLYLLLIRRYRAGIVFALTAAALVGATILTANLVTDGKYWLNTVDGLQASVRWANLTLVVERVFLPNRAPCFLALLALALQVYRRRITLFATAFVVSFSLATSATIRSGSDANYFMESMALACLLVGMELHRWRAGLGHSRGAEPSAKVPAYGHSGLPAAPFGPFGQLAALIAVGVAILCYEPPMRMLLTDFDHVLTPFAERHPAAEYSRWKLTDAARLIDEVARGRPVLCQDDSMSLHLSSEPVVMDWYLFSGFCDHRVFRDAHLVADNIRTGYYGAVVLERAIEKQQSFSYQGTKHIPALWYEALTTPPRPYRFLCSPGAQTHVYVPAPSVQASRR